jgi:dihydrofolate synthase/folylpolyglutamate synthase
MARRRYLLATSKLGAEGSLERSSEVAPLDYAAALRRVMSLADFERSAHSPGHAVFHLERMKVLLERLGNPHLGVPTVHVAGTKGKGSTAAMVTSMLTAGGHLTGLYTSPHLHTAVERIRVGLEPIGRTEFAALVDRAWPAVEWVGEKGNFGPVTTFELLTVMALLHYKQIGADFQVIEVGLGGRLDATNVVSPDVCVITSISLDHTLTLGDTLALIATEKAGIIKRNVPVVVAPQAREALDVFVAVSVEREAPIVQVDKQVSWQLRSADVSGQSFDVAGLRGSYRVWMPLLGEHQLENAGTAIATVETLIGRGLDLSSESIIEGLRRVSWPGRLEILSRQGVQVVVDGAHNPYSVGRLVRAVRDLFRGQRVILIFGATSGHSARGMMAEVADLAPTVIAVRSRHPRSAPTQTIASAAREQGLPVSFESDDVALATRRALGMAGQKDLVLGTGSLSVVAEVIEEMRGITPEIYPYINRPPAN